MRIMEYVVLVLLAAYLVAPNLWWRPWIPLVAAVAGGAHLVVEGYRWQMVPLYVLTAIFVALNAPRLLGRRPKPLKRGWAVAGLVAGVLALVAAAAPPILFPVPVLPAPGGPYQVGTVTFQWTDPARLEGYSTAPDDQRTIMVQVWYPAVPAANAQTAPWLDRLDVVGPLIAKFLNLPSFFLDHASLLKTHTYAGASADAASATYPVVVYSHGWTGFRTVNLNQSEALASHGYIAVAVDHTYGAMVTVFADGRVALNNPDALPSGVPDDVYQAATEVLEATYAADLSFTLDQLALVNAGTIPSPLTGKLDLDSVGVYGHSTGGGATVVMCAQDERCDAALSMDPWVGPVPRPVLAAGLRQPFLAMMSEQWSTGENNALLDELLAAGSGDNYKMVIAGTKHYDFTMLPLLTPLAPALGFKGPINGERGMQIVTDYLVGFFDAYLKGTGSAAREGYPEVTWEAR
jgi:predicted dienelactone hydrolase